MTDLHDHDRGLALDLSTLLRRRDAMKLMAGAALASLVGCSGDATTETAGGGASTSATGAASSVTTSAASTASSATSTATSAAPATAVPTTSAAPATTAALVTTVAPIPTTATPLSSCTTIPSETGGPFPGDGSNGPNVLTQSGIVRRDMRPSFGASTVVASGIPLLLNLRLVDTGNGCKPLAGAAVYAWHCDIDGKYSLYDNGVQDRNYLRGVQAADASGQVSFQTIFPAAYSGRWPHIHFEIYPSLAVATSSDAKLITSQLALPAEACAAAFATAGYESSASFLGRNSIENDNVFGDGYDLQLPKVTGSAAAGFVADLVIGV